MITSRPKNIPHTKYQSSQAWTLGFQARSQAFDLNVLSSTSVSMKLLTIIQFAKSQEFSNV